MYISKDGTVLYSDLDKLMDRIEVNLNLDEYDVAFSNLGIRRSFSGNTISDYEDFVRREVSDLIYRLGAKNTDVKNVSYDDEGNVFNVEISASGISRVFTL